MNYSAIASASSAVLLVVVALVLAGISRAPGWERAKAFSWVAVTAAAYSACDLFMVADSFRPAAQLWMSRLQFSAGALHGAAWLNFAFASHEPRARRLARWIVVFHGVAVGGLVPGLMLKDTWRLIEVEALGVRLTTFPLTNLGNAAGMLMLAGIAVAFARVARDGAAAAPLTPLTRLGFVAFYCCAGADFLTAAGVLELVPLGGIGFLAALLPVAVYMMRAFVTNAHRLDVLSGDLMREVQARTSEVLQVHRALADAERHASIGRVAAGVAHEINNPLAWLVLNADLLRDYGRSHALPAEVQESIAGVLDGADRIKEAVEALRARTRWSPGMRVTVTPDRLLRMALKSAAAELHQSHELIVEIGETPLVVGDEAELLGAFADVLAGTQRVGSAPETRTVLRISGGTAPDGWAAFQIERAPSALPVGIEGSAGWSAARVVFERHGGVFSIRDAEGVHEISVRLPPSREQVTSDGRIGRLSLASIP